MKTNKELEEENENLKKQVSVLKDELTKALVKLVELQSETTLNEQVA